ncbi:MAG: XTP/dITP diphosphatase [Promethearchaeota archaeon]
MHFITGNSHKFREARDKLVKALPGVELVREEADLLEIQADSIEDVARFKVGSARALVEGSFFVEDAGFFVDAYPGFPGVYSAYIHRMLGNEGILKLMDGRDDRGARFEAVIGFFDARTEETHLFKGVVEGSVALSIRGENGFGFDPIFVPDDDPDHTFGELTSERKNEISHRARALEAFVGFLVGMGLGTR